MPTISYAITACNEHVELNRLLTFLDSTIRPEDEIVVQLDLTATSEVRQVAEKFNVGTKYEYHRIFFPLQKDFAAFKNNLKKHCTRDYIFQIDADEVPEANLIEILPSLLEANPTVEVILVPRINIVEGITEEHIKAWGWFVDSNDGRINYPDYQWRIWKNLKSIQWVNKVHERLEGFKEFTTLPSISGFNLLHPKTIDKQELQNKFYSTL